MNLKWIIALIALTTPIVWANEFKVVCFYDSSNPSGITADDLENALGDCSHFIYGYATLTPRYHTLAFDGATQRTLAVTDVASLKEKFPRIKFLLSLGGNRDNCDSQKYLDLLEAKVEKQQNFIVSALHLVKLYKFDGLDLAYQFPRNEVAKNQDGAVQFWQGIRNLFKSKTKDQAVQISKHKKLFTNLVQLLSSNFKPQKLMLTLSVLPNVDPSWYFDIPSLQVHLDFVNLWSFDFHNPNRNPKEADFPSPLLAPPNKGDDMSFNNADAQVRYWLSKNITATKVVLGLPTYGRTWKMSTKSSDDGIPIVKYTAGPSGIGEESQTPGLLNWAEICELLKNRTLVVSGSYDHGQYFVYPASESFPHDTWIGFDGPNVAHYKSLYAKEIKLGGVAEIDLSSDDYRGSCTGLRFPILRYVNDIFSEN